MTPTLFTSAPNFRAVVSGFLELHRLRVDGRNDSEEANAVRDALDIPWEGLSPVEEARIAGLSEDLYSISDPLPAGGRPAMSLEAQSQLSEAMEARQQADWDRALAILRRWKEMIAPDLLSYLRGTIWLGAGVPQVAAFFFRHAADLSPDNANYQAISLYALDVSDPTAARTLAERVVQDDSNHAPVVVARAADIVFKGCRARIAADTRSTLDSLIPVLERNARRIEQDPETPSRASSYAMTVGLLGFCSEALGRDQAAFDWYSVGLRLNPRNAELLVARGILRYGTDPGAVQDFEAAVELGSPVVWPYFFLAHHYLLLSRFEDCLVMCDSGVRRTNAGAIKSELLDWKGIAEAELESPARLVRSAFEAALRADPANDRARRNQITFDTAIPGTGRMTHLPWDRRAPLALRSFGLAEARYTSRTPDPFGRTEVIYTSAA